MNRLILLFVFVASIICAQSYFITGKITDAINGLPLSYANIRVLNSFNGTAANINGEYSLKLQTGKYLITASFIGFKSDTIEINLNLETTVDFKLRSVTLEINEVTVTPGVNPASRIIEKTVRFKKEQALKIKDYSLTAFTKGLIKTTEDITSGDNSISVGLGTSDSTELKITGILENESKAFYQIPDNYKEEIVARKQTANFPPSINTLTGGRLIQNFYTEDLQFFGNDMINPVSDEALDYYFFYLEDSLAFDNQKVYRIYFEPEDKSDPGFTGRLFISSENYGLMKIDCNLNDAANPGGIFTKVNVFQQFQYFDKYYMPIDYRLFVEANVLGLARFGFEINTIMYDYSINAGVDSSKFGMSVLTVLPDADQKDAAYWTTIQSIPSTLDETKAYERLDSLESVEKTFWERFSFFSPFISIGKNYYVTGTLGLYNFNRVEGHGLNFGVYADNIFDRRLNAAAEMSYGFSDKKYKWNLSAGYLMGDYRTKLVEFSASRKLKVLFGESDEYNALLPTLTSLFGKYDFKDYFYRDEYRLKLKTDVFPFFDLELAYSYLNDHTAFLNSDFSFFNRKKKYDANPAIYETVTSAIIPGFSIDFRKYIEDGYHRRRVSLGKSYSVLSGQAFISNESLGSDLDFIIYKLNWRSELNSFRTTRATLKINSFLSNDPVPYQLMYALPGNVPSLGQDFTVRTLNFAEVYGDKVITIGLEYYFNSELFTLLNIPVLEDMQLDFRTHLNAAWSEISRATESLNKYVLPANPIEFKNPLFEAGFSIGQVLFPLRLEFTWRLNHRGKNNFVFGINSVMF